MYPAAGDVHNHIAGGTYGATGVGVPYVTGAVVQGSQAGAAGGGQAAATGAGRHQFPQPPQQQQPAELAVNAASATRKDILFIARVSLPDDSVE
jgi:hypothetical protein